MKKIALVALIALVCGIVNAATVTNITGTSASLPSKALDHMYVLENTYSFASGVSSGDVVKVIGYKPNTLVMAVQTQVLTTNSNGSATFSVGDTGSTTRYTASINMNAASTNVSAASAWYLVNGTANSVDLCPLAAITGGTVRVRAIVADLSR